MFIINTEADRPIARMRSVAADLRRLAEDLDAVASGRNLAGQEPHALAVLNSYQVRHEVVPVLSGELRWLGPGYPRQLIRSLPASPVVMFDETNRTVRTLTGTWRLGTPTVRSGYEFALFR